MGRSPLAAVLAALALAGCGGDAVEGPPPSAPDSMHLTSPAFAAGAAIPKRFTCDGEDFSPPLRWTGVPAGARSLALLMEDPEADGTFMHWTVFAIAPDATNLHEGEVPQGAREGENSFGDTRYGGPCPPEGDPSHRYVFSLYALRQAPDLEPGASPDDVRAAIAGAAIARGQLTGRYGR
ncbi:MAG TPA: YbhB/YbcL family Raf kinase inhibitor-like protein [Solirubrobacteraceae bacterium]|nr:YbhB/YbcL family Raf kinase inhibitor-like protein [Solirubrobacteraceae bacterium]